MLRSILLVLSLTLGVYAQEAITLGHLNARGTAQGLSLGRVDMAVDLRANIACIRLTLEVENPHDFQGEGELRLPLREDQRVVGFAIDIEGRMREATLLDRAQATNAYRTLVSQRVDPGLLERENARMHRLRIFPIPPRGRRTVRLIVEQPAESQPEGLVWKLPLTFAARVSAFHFALMSHGATPVRILASPLVGLTVKPSAEGFTAQAQAEAYQPNGELVVLSPTARDEAICTLGAVNGEVYAAAHLALPAWKPEARPLRRILLAWDCSESARVRDRAREWAALEDLLGRYPEAQVEVVAFHATVFDRRTFESAGRHLDRLKAHLFGLPILGTCNLGCLDFRRTQADAVLVCSPGIRRLYPGDPKLGQVPVHVLVSDAASDLVALRALARRTGGDLVDLSGLSRREAHRVLIYGFPHLLKVEVLEGEIAEALPQPGPVGRELSFACILRSAAACVRLHFRLPDGGHATRDVRLRRSEATQGHTLASRLWAAQRLAVLEAERPSSRKALRDLALKHGLVTQDTALLVLETLADYLRFNVAPPPELREAFEKIRPKPVAAMIAPKVKEIPDFTEDLAAWRAARHQWWAQRIPEGLKPVKKVRFGESSTRVGEEPPPPPPLEPSVVLVPGCPGLSIYPPPGAPGGRVGGDEDVAFRPGQTLQEVMRHHEAMPVAFAGAVAAGVPGGGVAGSGMAVAGAGGQHAPEVERGPTLLAAILPKQESPLVLKLDVPEAWPASGRVKSETPARLRHWRPDGERAKALSAAPPAERWALFQAYRGKYCPSPAFFTDCARIFKRAGQPAWALGILTTWAEGLSVPGMPDVLKGVPEPDLGRLGDLLEEMGDLEGADYSWAKLNRDGALGLRRAELAERQGLPERAASFLDAVTLGAGDQEGFDPIQGIALEARLALQLRHPRLPKPHGPALEVWGLRVEVEAVSGSLPSSALSLVDPRGERVCEEMPLGTRGLGFDSSVSPFVFMARKPTPGTYHLELASRQIASNEHAPLELRIRIIRGFGTPGAVVEIQRARLSSTAAIARIATFHMDGR